MSLGFLTESALLPSKAKAIKVDSNSLVDLRAVVFQKEQEHQARKHGLRDALLAGDGHKDGSAAAAATAGGGTRGFGRFAHLKAKKKRGGSAALSREEEKIGKASNRGVEKRRRQDEVERENELDEQDDDKAWHKKSREMLAKKARLYDDMMSGRVSASRSSAAAVAECLVDFGAKKTSKIDVAPAAALVREASESVEIMDEFGRTRTVTKDSNTYAEFLRLQARTEADSVPSSVPSEQGEDLQRQPPSQPDGGSFVVSQWEKRFNSEEKTYLQEVHEGVNHAKSAFVDKKTRKQLRLEKLRRQAGANSAPAHSDGPPLVESRVTTQDEQAAAVKATEFLNQLGSLM